MDRRMKAQITIRDLNKMTKADIKSLTSWLRNKAHALDDAVKPGAPWLVTRKDFVGLFHYRLMK